MTRESSCLRFLESQREKYNQFLRSGDVSIDTMRKSKVEVDRELRSAKKLIAEGMTRKEAAAIVGMNYQTLTKRLNNGK